MTPPRSAGPRSGTLLIMGGGPQTDEIRQEAVKIAGIQARWVVITTNGKDEDLEEAARESLPAQVGASYTVMHTRDRSIADTPAFAEPLESADAVWFCGGRQYRVMDTYGGTRTEAGLRGVLARGGLLAGTSAGATIMGSYLVRGHPSDDYLPMMVPGHEAGLGLVSNTAIDQHILPRRRWNDLAAVIDAHPGLLGIGIDESTAIVVRESIFTVIGRGLVLITDGESHGGRPFYPLLPGEAFDLASWQRLEAQR